MEQAPEAIETILYTVITRQDKVMKLMIGRGFGFLIIKTPADMVTS